MLTDTIIRFYDMVIDSLKKMIKLDIEYIVENYSIIHPRKPDKEK
jgi:hypothetical protein